MNFLIDFAQKERGDGDISFIFSCNCNKEENGELVHKYLRHLFVFNLNKPTKRRDVKIGKNKLKTKNI